MVNYLSELKRKCVAKNESRGGETMAKDYFTGKHTRFGNKRSHALNANRRSWKPNLQKVTILVNGKPKKVYVSARTLKSGKVTRA